MSVTASPTMYAAYFGLQQPPFSIAPDPRYLYMSERHREALAHLLYGVGGGGGFVLLSGEIGAGKTTVCRCFLEQIPRRCNVAYIFNPKLTAVELLKSVCEEFRIPYSYQGTVPATVKDYLDPLNDFLLRTHAVGQNNVLVIDEAQNLSADVLEQLRLLTNLETSERKLLQIILIGQPELRGMLARPELEQLAQRVIARYHLDALSEAETAHYIRHRMAVAGLSTALPFDRAALKRIHRLSRGVPRRINLLCDRALLGAYAEGRNTIGTRIVARAGAEVFAPPRRGMGVGAGWGSVRRVGLAVSGVVVLTCAAWLALGRAPAAGAAQRRAEARLSPAVVASGARSVASGTGAGAGGGGGGGADIRTADAGRPNTGTGSDVRTAVVSSAAVDGVVSTSISEQSQAWRQLALYWNARLGPGDACAVATAAQLHCYSRPMTLAMIRQFGRPGILTLQPPNGRPVYVLLTGLTPTEAVLRGNGGTAQRVALTALAGVWRGEFATYWKSPFAGADSAVGDPGRLAALLDQASGHPAASVPRGDAALRTQLRAFQMVQGLAPDGVAGPTTYMQLNRAAGIDEPRLQPQG